MLIPIAVYFAVVTGSHFDIEARHLLPIYPFLYVLVSGGLRTRFGAKDYGFR